LLAFKTILRGLDIRNGLQCPCVREGLFQRTLPRFLYVITIQIDTYLVGWAAAAHPKSGKLAPFCIAGEIIRDL